MTDDMSRRKFMQVGTVSTAGLLSSGTLENPDNPKQEYEFQGAAHLIGHEEARPEVGSGYFDNKKYFAYLYEVNEPASVRGTKYYITDSDSDWTVLDEPMPETQVGEVKVEDHTSFFNHTFARPEAPDSKNWSFTDADVTKIASEVELASTTVLETTQRGNYPPGTEAIPGIAWRSTGTPTAGRADAGYCDQNNGFGAGEDDTDSYVFVRKSGDEHRVYRGDWNGYNPSGRVWQSDSPVITRFPHLFYGGGNIRVRALLHENGESRIRTLHTITPENVPSGFGEGPPFDQPNLPVRFESSSLSGASLRANASHYEFGESSVENRVNGEVFTGVSVGTSGWTPLIAWRKRPGWEMVNVKPLKIGVATSGADVKVEIQLNPALGTPTWTLPENSSSSETAVEVDVSGTLDASGERRWVDLITADGGNKTSNVKSQDLTFNLPATQPIVLAAQAIGSSATVSGVVGWEEYY